MTIHLPHRTPHAPKRRATACTAALLALALAACTLQVEVETTTPAPQPEDDTPTETAQPAASPDQPASPAGDTPTGEPAAPATTDEPPATAGPVGDSGAQVIYVTTQEKDGAVAELHALNPATGESRVLWDFAAGSEMLHAPANLQDGISPDGHLMAFISGTAQSLEGLTLRVVNIEDGSVVEALALVSAATGDDAKPVIASHGEYLTCYDACAGTPGGTSLAWSPDGTRLAFVGAMDGPSADLYVLSLADGGITRLTDGPSQGTTPAWSPDGRYVVHAGLEVVATHDDRPEYAREEWGIGGVWAARADGSAVETLYAPEGSIREFFASWLDADTFLSYSWSFQCGAKTVRRVSIPGGVEQIVWPGAFEEAAVASTFDAMLLDNSGLTPACLGEDYPGTYAITPVGELAMNVIAPETGGDLRWSPEAERLFAAVRTPEGNEITALDPSREQTFYSAPLPATPLAAPGNAYWAWWTVEPGIGNLQITPAGGDDPVVFDSGATHAVWLPDPAQPSLVVFTINSIVVLRAPGFETQTLVEGIHVENLRYGGMRVFTPGVAP